MKTHYFTLGQSHIHKFGKWVLDKDCVIKITDAEPLLIMMICFETEWAFEYEKCPEMKYFPRGIYNLTEDKWE